jgi:hypothetical protein
MQKVSVSLRCLRSFLVINWCLIFFKKRRLTGSYRLRAESGLTEGEFGRPEAMDSGQGLEATQLSRLCQGRDQF